MRRTLLTSSVLALSLFFARPSVPQTPAAQATPTELVAQYNQAIKVQDWPAALADAQQLAGANATSANLLMLGNAQLYAASAQHDTSGIEAAIATYDRALSAAEQEKPAKGQPNTAWKDGASSIYLWKGNALLKLKRNTEAVGAYNRSAELSANPGRAYFNICAVLYNTGDNEHGPDACRKAAAVDPTHADTWFVLGSFLFAGAKADAQGNASITDETRDALKKYLELAPDGPHAADVKAMLDMAAK